MGMRSLWEDVVAVAELLGAPWLLLQAGGGSVALRVPLWPLMGSREKRKGRSKAALPAETQLNKRDGLV